MTTTKTRTTQEVAARFNELAQQEKWFDIQQDLFAENVRSVDPENSPYFPYAEGKEAVRKKGESFVGRVTAMYKLSTSEPLVAGNHFAVARDKELEVTGFGRVHINEIMLYEVKDGEIVLEQFFYTV